MSFTNRPEDPGQLPRANQIAWTSLPIEHTREVRLQCILTVAVLIMVSWLQGILIPYPQSIAWLVKILPLLVLLVGSTVSLLILKKIRYKGYALREHDIAYRSGLFWRKAVILPFNRIQHVEVASGPLQRYFGLATLKFFTAGGSSVDLKIEGLLSTDAERLRAHILARGAPGERSAIAVPGDSS